MKPDKMKPASQDAKPICLTGEYKIAHRTQNSSLRKESLGLMVIIATAASACGNVAIGPVDHGCYVNPARAQGSGCER